MNMMTVWKFSFDVNDNIIIRIPKNAHIIHVQEQHGIPCIWALVNPDEKVENRRFRLAGTGHPLPDNVGKHLGSFFMMGGELVFHLFDEDESE